MISPKVNISINHDGLASNINVMDAVKTCMERVEKEIVFTTLATVTNDLITLKVVDEGFNNNSLSDRIFTVSCILTQEKEQKPVDQND